MGVLDAHCVSPSSLTLCVPGMELGTGEQRRVGPRLCLWGAQSDVDGVYDTAVQKVPREARRGALSPAHVWEWCRRAF